MVKPTYLFSSMHVLNLAVSRLLLRPRFCSTMAVGPLGTPSAPLPHPFGYVDADELAEGLHAVWWRAWQRVASKLTFDPAGKGERGKRGKH